MRAHSLITFCFDGIEPVADSDSYESAKGVLHVLSPSSQRMALYEV